MFGRQRSANKRSATQPSLRSCPSRLTVALDFDIQKHSWSRDESKTFESEASAIFVAGLCYLFFLFMTKEASFWNLSEAIEIFAGGDSREYGHVDGETHWPKSKLLFRFSGRSAMFGSFHFCRLRPTVAERKFFAWNSVTVFSFILTVVTFYGSSFSLPIRRELTIYKGKSAKPHRHLGYGRGTGHFSSIDLHVTWSYEHGEYHTPSVGDSEYKRPNSSSTLATVRHELTRRS